MAEGGITGDPRRALIALRELSDLGVVVAVDDFGTGCLSLACLQRLPIAQLKIDQSFVQNMLARPGDAAIVRSTIGLAHDLGLRVVAEGVEDEVVWQALRDWGCDVAQGFFVARPLPADVFVARVICCDGELRFG